MGLYKVPFDAQVFALEKLLKGSDTIKFGLYKNSVTGMSLVLGDLIEPSNFSYNSVLLDKDYWTCFSDSDGNTTAFNLPITFNFAFGSSETIYGAFGFDSADNRLLWVQEFPVAQIVAGSLLEISITPVYGVSQK